MHDLFPWLCRLFADSAYPGDKLLNTSSRGLEAYLRQHPNGHFADLARTRLASRDMN